MQDMEELCHRRFAGAVRSTAYASINIFGLAIGLAACILIMILRAARISYDTWLPSADRVYQLQAIYCRPQAAGWFTRR